MSFVTLANIVISAMSSDKCRYPSTSAADCAKIVGGVAFGLLVLAESGSLLLGADVMNKALGTSKILLEIDQKAFTMHLKRSVNIES